MCGQSLREGRKRAWEQGYVDHATLDVVLRHPQLSHIVICTVPKSLYTIYVRLSDVLRNFNRQYGVCVAEHSFAYSHHIFLQNCLVA